MHLRVLRVAVITLLASLVLFPATAFADDQGWIPEGYEVANADDIEFVYVNARELSTSDTQYVAVSFASEIENATLLYSGDSGDQYSVDASNIVEGVALFPIKFELPATYKLTGVAYTSSEGAALYCRFEQSIADGSAFEVLQAVSKRAVEDDLDVDFYTFDENNNLVEADDFGQSMDEGANVGAISLFSERSGDDGAFVVVIDPGHGGYDPGAVGNGLCESNLNLKIALACRDELSKYAHTKVYLTRSNDTFVGLEERAQYAQQCGADLFISIHINAGGGTGAEVWIPTPNAWYPSLHEVGNELAGDILAKLESVGLGNRGAQWEYYTDDGGRFYPDGSRADGLSVIRNCRLNGIQAVLVEHGYIDRAYDAGLLRNDAKLKEMGVADAQAIVDYYGLKLPQPLYGFADVFDDTYHSMEIGWLAAAGISTGYVEDGTFRPYENVTRAQMAAFLYRLAGEPDYAPSDADRARFSDIDASEGFCKEIWWLGSTGISAGYEDGTFRPGAPVTRSDMAAFLRRFTAQHFDSSALSWSPSSESWNFFSDVNSSTNHVDDVLWLASNGVSAGYDDGTFRPYACITRSDMAAFLYRLTNLPGYVPAEEDKSVFPDVSSDTDHSNEIWWLAAAGISTGYVEDGTFRPYENVTRAQMAAFLYRLAGEPDYAPSDADRARFSDIDASEGFCKEIWWLGSTGISAGYEDGTFRPGAPVTRSDMAAFLRRTYDHLTANASQSWAPSVSSRSHFTDVDSSMPHAEDVWWLGETGISLGYVDGSFGMWGSVTRSDMAAFMYRLNIRVNRVVGQFASIMGESLTNAEQMVRYFESTGKRYPSDVYESKGAKSIEEFAQIVFEESKAEGVRAEVVFCQAMVETGWLQFGGLVKAEQCNFAGIGAVNANEESASFSDVRTGVRAQVQHLKAYASTDALSNECVDPRFDLVSRGIAPLLTDLNGKWAVPGDGYGESILQSIFKLLSF